MHRHCLDPVQAPVLKPPGPPSSSLADHWWKQRGGTRWVRFCQGFSNHHDQIPPISPSAAYSPQTLALAVTGCAGTSMLLLYSIHSLQPYLYIVHWKENCSDCTFLYNCKVPNPPTRLTVTLTAHKPWIPLAEFPGAFMQYITRNIFRECADDKNPHRSYYFFCSTKQHNLQHSPSIRIFTSKSFCPAQSNSGVCASTQYNLKLHHYWPISTPPWKTASKCRYSHRLPPATPALAMI